MKNFYTVLAVICIVVILFLIAFQSYTMMWGKVVLTFATVFLVSSIMNIFDAIKKQNKIKTNSYNNVLKYGQPLETKGLLMKKTIIVFTTMVILCSFFLLGCNEGSKEATNLQKLETNQMKETNENSRYNEILKIIENYELPSEGKTKEEEYTISYENGYTFHKDTKQIVSRTRDDKSGPEEPTKGQYLGVILGSVEDVSHTEPWNNVENSQDIEGKLGRLNEIKKYADNYEPIKNWIDETISYLDESQKLIKTDNKRAEELYNMACKNFESFSEIINLYAEKQINK